MLKLIRKFLVNHFSFSYTETKAFLYLLSFLLISLIMMIVLPDLLTQSYNNYEQDSKDLEKYLSELEDNYEEKSIFTPLQLKSFDPNQVEKEALLEMRIPENIVSNLIKYRNKGGVFYEKDEFRKIYGLTDSLYTVIEPYLQIEDKKKFPDNSKNNKEKYKAHLSNDNKLVATSIKKVRKELKIFDLNEADTSQLKQIYGVGDVLSVRIIKYRNILGGFVNKHQLAEVYGLSTEVVENIKKASIISSEFEPDKININFASIAELKKHPYLEYEDAVQIVNFRNKKGPFKNEKHLIKSKVLSPEKVEKINRYIKY